MFKPNICLLFCRHFLPRIPSPSAPIMDLKGFKVSPGPRPSSTRSTVFTNPLPGPPKVSSVSLPVSRDFKVFPLFLGPRPSSTSSTRSTMFTNPLPRPPRVSSVSLPVVRAENVPTLSTSAGLNKRGVQAVTEDRITVTGRKRVKLDKDQANVGVDHSQFTLDEEGYVVVYTDGACKSNGKGKEARAGIGVWFEDNHALNISERVKGRQTNNTAEIQAAERAIWQAKSAGIDMLNLKTDSQFTINCVTKWLQNWKRNGWKLANKKDVKNREDLEKLDKATHGMQIKWSYVKAHSGHRGNEAADRLAVEGSLK